MVDALYGKLTPIMNGITDVKTANAAIPSMDALSPSFTAAGKTLKRLGDPSPEEQAAFIANATHADDFAAAMVRLMWAEPEV